MGHFRLIQNNLFSFHQALCVNQIKLLSQSTCFKLIINKFNPFFNESQSFLVFNRFITNIGGKVMEESQRIAILKHLIQLKSENAHELKVAQYLQQVLDEHHIENKIIPFDDDRANLIAEIGQGRDPRILGWSGHMDTVAVPDPNDWDHDPFGGEIVGDRLYGRGAADMKCGLAAQLIALIELVENKQIPEGKIRWLVTYGEENGAPGAKILTDQGYSQDLSALIISEPTSGNIVYAHSGFLNYQIESYGVAAHSSEPQKGVNAISNLIPFINAESQLFNDVPEDALLGLVSHSITVINGGKQINSIPNYAILQGNIRPTTAFSNEEVIAVLKAEVAKVNQLPQHQLKLTILSSFAPVATDPKGTFIQFLDKMTQEGFANDQVQLGIMKGGTDASLFTRKNLDLPVAILGPDKWDIAHQTNEYTTISSFNHLITTLELVAKNYFSQVS